MPVFEDLPFEEQLEQIRRVASAGSEVPALIARAASLPDVDPLCRLLEALAVEGWTEARLVGALSEVFSGLSDAALQRLLHIELEHPSTVAARLGLARGALERWTLDRASGLAVLSRWVARQDPDGFRALLDAARDRVEDDPRWVFFLDGPALAARSAQTGPAQQTTDAVRAVLDALARAPKSVSQANAEELLSRRVYADAGHFLFELMQNADDARASRWTVDIQPRCTVVTHDGVPFSFLDVVGVLSIGLTTKRADQIGMFGVGFKSVYEVTERPRIHSGAFDFEIAHVSIPRALGVRPEAGPEETVLVLPHRAEVRAERLGARARSIPKEVLMTLPHLTAFSVRSPGEPTLEVAMRREASTVTLRSGEERVTYRTGERAVGVPPEGSVRVLVAVRLDDDLVPIPANGPSLYSFLPTAERTGLDVIVHARFDVTVDRERLDPSSALNRTLLSSAGEILAGVLAELAEEGKPVLGVLPTEAALAPLVAPLAESLRSTLLEVECLPGMAGERLRPANARLLDGALGSALAGVDLGGGDRALADLSPRDAAAARFLGARPFGPLELLSWLERRLRPGEAAPSWLTAPVLRALAAASIEDARLRSLPIVVDGGGRLATAAAAQLAPAAWVELYAGVRALTTGEVFAASGLAARLRIAPFDPAQLVEDLGRHPELAEREARLFRALELAEDSLIEALRAVPLFRTEGGARRSVDSGLVRLAPGLEPLRGLTERPLVDRSIEAAYPRLVARAVPLLSLRELAATWELSPPADAAIDRIAAVLDREVERLPRGLVQRLAALALFRDRDGRARTLSGDRSARAAADPELPGLLPDWPWLAEPQRPFVLSARPAPMNANDVALELARIPSSVPEPFDLLDWLGTRRGDLTTRALEALRETSIFLDAAGARRTVRELRRETGSLAIEAFYRTTGQRFVAHPRTLDALRALGLDAALSAHEASMVVADLALLDPAVTVVVDVLGPLLRELAPSLSGDEVAGLLACPRFFDESGAPRALASLARPDRARVHPAGRYRSILRSGPYPLLDPELELALGPLIDRWGPPRPTVHDLVRVGAELGDPAALLGALLERPDALDADARRALSELPLVRSRAGALGPSRSLADPAALRAHLGEVALSQLSLDEALLDEPSASAVSTLGLDSRRLAELVETELLPRLEEGGALDAQPAPFHRVEPLGALLSLCLEIGIEVTSFPLAVDHARRLVRGPLLRGSTAARELATRLPLGERLADPTWAQRPEAAALLEPVSARAIAAALRVACREERRLEDHPILSSPTVLYDWLRADGDAIRADEAARTALSLSCVVPSARGTLRAPRNMVLRASAPASLGLSWGIAEDVPADIVAWLSDTFEMDRREQRAVVTHVLDAITEAVEEGERERVAALTRFLAQTLDAAAVDPEELEQKVRRLKVRARLRAPTEDGGFEKPRFSWAPTSSTYAEVRAFMEEVPRRIDPIGLDAASRALLAACGAKTDLDSSEVDALLRGEGRRPGADAACALASYVTRRALDEPRRVEEWKLASRAFVPDRAGRLRPPRDLFWPDPVAFALLGPEAVDFPDEEVVDEQPDDAGRRLGFATVEALSLREIAERLAGREATPVILDWLERSIATGRLDAGKLGAALRDSLLVRDDEGVVRPARSVARRGARALLGDLLGDFSFAASVPQLARALQIPDTPDRRMLVELLVEVGRGLGDRTGQERAALEPPVLELYGRLAEWARAGEAVKLPQDAVTLATKNGDAVLTRIGAPGLCVLSPPELAEALPLDDRESLLCPVADDPALDAVYLAAGVADLHARLRLTSVTAGPRVEAREAEAEQLLSALAPALGARARRVSLSDGLVATFTLRGGATEGGVYRSEGGEGIGPVPVDAALHGSILYLTPAALDDPRLLAPTLAPEPERRAAMVEWLARGELRRLPKRLRAERAASAPAETERVGFFDRVRRFFTADEPEPRPRPRATPKPEPSPTSSDEAFFRRRSEIRAQLDHGGGFSERRAQRPEYGFTFSPSTLASPWCYAPELISTRFNRRSQSWLPASLVRPPSVGEAGSVVLSGTLPKGESVLPLPLYGRVVEHSSSAVSRLQPRRSGACAIRLGARSDVDLRVTLGLAPDAANARVAAVDALASFVPDEELPEEALDFVAELMDEPSPLSRAFAVRDFIRRRYRYDPAYLEDPGVARWLSRIARSRANSHIAALHAGADHQHLGAGVCYELNALACELMRRAGVPAAIATGWLFLDGSMSEPDHLFALALLEDARGAPIFVPVDASSTEAGRPLRVPRRPPIKRRPRKEKATKPPRAPGWFSPADPARGGPRGGRAERKKKGEPSRKRRKVPRAELHRLLRYLATLSNAELTIEQRAVVEKALEHRESARELLERMLSRSR